MQYKIPIQIENEDVIVAGLSLRQLVIMMIWGGIAYAVFKGLEPRIGPKVGFVFALPIVVMGIIIALAKVAEMTFLPLILNYIRLTLNAQSRIWSQGTDGYSEADIGYIPLVSEQALSPPVQSIESLLREREEINDKILKL